MNKSQQLKDELSIVSAKLDFVRAQKESARERGDFSSWLRWNHQADKYRSILMMLSYGYCGGSSNE